MKRKSLIYVITSLSVLFLFACSLKTENTAEEANKQSETNATVTDKKNSEEPENDSKYKLTNTGAPELTFNDLGNHEYCKKGVGGNCFLTIKTDGSFTGLNFSQLSNRNNGWQYDERGDIDYCDGYNLCEFSGKFSNLKKLNDFTYEMTVEKIENDDTPRNYLVKDYYMEGVDGVIDLTSNCALSEGDRFVVYAPGTPTAYLEEVLDKNLTSGQIHKFCEFDTEEWEIVDYSKIFYTMLTIDSGEREDGLIHAFYFESDAMIEEIRSDWDKSKYEEIKAMLSNATYLWDAPRDSNDYRESKE